MLVLLPKVTRAKLSGTYSPAIRYVTIRRLLVLVTQLKIIVYQMDAVTAFLHDDLDDKETCLYR